MNPHVEQLIDMALAEDIGDGDVTSEYFVPANKMARAFMLVKEDGVVAGLDVVEAVFKKVDSDIVVKRLLPEGSRVTVGARPMEISGSARSLLTAERTALNFMQRLSGIATKTAQFVAETKDAKAEILDTRKTTPGWRLLEKMAVVAGGGTNHRMGLYDRAMVKDNHLVAEGGLELLQKSIKQLKQDKPGVEVEMEADRLEQVEAFLQMEGVDYILLDNMTNEQMAEAVSMRGSHDKPKLEASGGVVLDRVSSIASTGVDFISVGAITHSAVALDISLEFVEL
ncbi:Nicotinate-nucleotide pyrophosphorylase [carboxylating] [Rubritalea halochordaticola]|uniref:nicotinate-nucleotide diphosphorylase (carboxylating) n=1 Tax=Rubritalea halochordaticola TaxID=714537 RepID=A0ABP9UXU6_9BACT